MKKLMKKKNNKGFSLVELIVVVLILGIIAVALAPQVMKWVGTARENSDKNTAKDIKAAINIAVADYQADGHSLAANETFTIDSTLTGINDANMKSKIAEVLNGDYPVPANPTLASKKYEVTITKEYVVTVTY